MIRSVSAFLARPSAAHGTVTRRLPGVLTFALLVVLGAQPSLAQQPPNPQALAAQAAAAASWPHTIQPQAIEWPERKRLKARAALSITRPNQPRPLMGTIELTLSTTVDDATGVVR